MGTLIRSSYYISAALIGWNGVHLCPEGRRLNIIPHSKTSSPNEQNFLIYHFEASSLLVAEQLAREQTKEASKANLLL